LSQGAIIDQKDQTVKCHFLVLTNVYKGACERRDDRSSPPVLLVAVALVSRSWVDHSSRRRCRHSPSGSWTPLSRIARCRVRRLELGGW